MLSVRAALCVASLLALTALATPASAVTTHKRAHHKHAPHKQSQAQAPGNQVEVFNGSSRTVQDLDVQQKPTSSPGKSAIATSKVDVINGYSERTQVFNGDQSSAGGQGISLSRKKTKFIAPGKTPGSPPRVFNVEVFNGARTETRTFNGDPEQMTAAERYRRSHQLVVVGFESADSARRRRNSAPVVARITTSESESERAKANPVVVAIASSESKNAGADAPPTPPMPSQNWTSPSSSKRPPYHPAPPPPQ